MESLTPFFMSIYSKEIGKNRQNVINKFRALNPELAGKVYPE